MSSPATEVTAAAVPPIRTKVRLPAGDPRSCRSNPKAKANAQASATRASRWMSVWNTGRLSQDQLGPHRAMVGARGGEHRAAPTRTSPRTRMWSIWLWGFQAGQVRPFTARCQSGRKARTGGPHRFMSPSRTASGLASVRNSALSVRVVAVRPVLQVRHVGAHNGQGPALSRHVHHNGRPAHPVSRAAWGDAVSVIPPPPGRPGAGEDGDPPRPRLAPA